MGQDRIKETIGHCLAAAFLVLFVCLLIWSDATKAGLALAAAFAVEVFANLDKFESFKAAGFEAKMREASALVSGLKELAAMTAASLIEANEGSGRLAARDSYAKNDRFKDRVLDTLRRLQIEPERIAEAGRADREFVIVDYLQGIRQLGHRNGELQAERLRAWDAAWAAMHDELDEDEHVRPSDAARLLAEFGIDDQEARELVADLRFYVKQGVHRRPEHWRRRGEWLRFGRERLSP